MRVAQSQNFPCDRTTLARCQAITICRKRSHIAAKLSWTLQRRISLPWFQATRISLSQRLWAIWISGLLIQVRRSRLRSTRRESRIARGPSSKLSKKNRKKLPNRLSAKKRNRKRLPNRLSAKKRAWCTGGPSLRSRKKKKAYKLSLLVATMMTATKRPRSRTKKLMISKQIRNVFQSRWKKRR